MCVQMVNVAEIFFYFIGYAFGGWLLENVYSWVTTGVFFKEGFLYGPLKPMYGFAPVLIVYSMNESTHWSFLLLLCLIIPTVIEYASGVLLERLFHQRYWDYRHLPLQLQGHICVSFSICWVLLSLAVVVVLHPLFQTLYSHVSVVWGTLWPMFALILLADLVVTMRNRSRAVRGHQPV